MTDEQKKKKPGQERIGSIHQWETFGSENDESEPSEKPDSQIASNPVSQMVHYPESRHAEFSASQIAESQDKKMVSYLREKKPERKAQIVYLPPGLIEKLKRFAFDHHLEISVVAQVAISEYLEKQENRQI